MILTVPTTLAGVAALVSYVVECERAGWQILNLDMDGGGDREVPGAAALMQTLDAALSEIVRS
jgi:hypothetical protein